MKLWFWSIDRTNDDFCRRFTPRNTIWRDMSTVAALHNIKNVIARINYFRVRKVWPNELFALWTITATHHNDALTSVWCDEDVIRYTSIGTPCTRKEVETKCRLLQDHDVFAIFRGKTSWALSVCLRMDCKKSFSAYFTSCGNRQGQGNGTEAVGWLLNFMRKKYSGLSW